MKRGATVSQTVAMTTVSPISVLNANGSSVGVVSSNTAVHGNDSLPLKSSLVERGLPSLAPLNGPLPALPTLSTPLHLEPTGSGLDRQIEPIVKESGKNGIIAPIAVLRPRADSFEAAKKESLPVFADTSITGATKVFPLFEETSIQSKIPPPDVLTTPEFRKSKSLTRKIKELSGREPRMEGSVCISKEGFSTLDGTLPVSLTAITALDRIPLVRSTSGNATSIKPISNSLDSVAAPLMKERERDLQPLNQHLRESPVKVNPIHLNISNSPAVISKSKSSSSSLQSAKTAVAIPNLTLEKLNSSTASDKSDLDDSLNSFYQHYALPKSLSSTGGKAIAGDLSGRSSAATGLTNGAAAQVQKPKCKANNVSYNEFVLVENDAVQADTLDKAAENDRILQERLQQAKALSRKDDNGATMHTFSLWKPKNQQQQQGNTSVAITTSNSSAVIGTTASNDESESNGVALVGKYSTRLRGVTAIVEQTSIAVDKESDNKSNLKHYDNSSLLENNISIIKIDAGNGEDYSDDEFVKGEESDSVIDRSVGTVGDGSTLSLNASKNLSNVLRSRIDDAKHFDESYVSNGNTSQVNGVNGLIDDFDCSYGSLGGRDDSEKVSASFYAPPFAALETSIHHLEDDDMSVGSVEEDVELALELQKASREMEQRGIGTDQVTPTTMMSRSGPAAFLSSIVLPTQVNDVVPAKHAVQDDDSLGQDARRASSGGLIMERSSGMQYEPIRLRSLTSRDMKENQQMRVSNGINGKSHRQVTMNDQEDVKTSKYKVLKSLRQSSRKQPASSFSTTEEGPWKTILSTKAPCTSPTMALITPSAGVGTADSTDNDKQRETMSSSPLSELSETDEIPPARPSNSKKSYLEEFDENNNADDQCPSPLKWKKGEVIGEGTFGKVFKGLNEKTGELLAIKQIALADGSNGEVDILRREISVMWDLDHPHIVRYMGTTKTNRYLFIIMEYVTGGSIASMLKQFGPFSEGLVRKFALHIISGVGYLHDKGIIHRDIKGANILVTDTGVAKLADFGCSKRMAGLCTASLEESMFALRGSVPWMAPEVIKQSGAGRSSDIWSFGATIIEMATGKPPWSEFSHNLAALFHVATSKDPPPIPSHVSESCAEFISRCLVINPDGRATAYELLNELRFLKNEVEKNSGVSLQGSLKKKKEGNFTLKEGRPSFDNSS